MSTYYFDDSEEGVARESSHPFFVEHARADFYYDCTDEFSPFGNDAGADALSSLEDWYREREEGENAEQFLQQLISNWGFDLNYLTVTEPDELDAIDSQTQQLNDQIDKAVIATAFGQYKLAGDADKAVLSMAHEAFHRQRYLVEKGQRNDTAPWEYGTQYLSRLHIMEVDLAAMTLKKAR
jgi:uncharacterized protein YfeS